MAGKRFVLEIGTEELPAAWVEPACAQIRAAIGEGLAYARLFYASVRTMGTPRRLVVEVLDLEAAQADRMVTVQGPPKQACFDETGRPTKALTGFAAAHGTHAEAVQIAQTEKGERAVLSVHEPGKLAEEVLSELLPRVVLAPTFPKTMRWAHRRTRYGRPIRWLLAILDDTAVTFAIEDIESGRTTRGHRFLGEKSVSIPRAGDYAETLRRQSVLVDPEERREEIRRQVLAAASALGGTPMFLEEQLEENLYLVEYPTAFVGRFAEEFLRLPAVVLTTVMRKQQRYFPVAGPDGKLLPAFIGVRNGGSEHIERVAAGNEIVVNGRFRDAVFFFERDVARPLRDRVADLDRVIFLHGLGTLGEKTRRVASLCAEACDQLGADDRLRAHVLRAAGLCKADLTTSLVIEFTSLQGVIGGVYARVSGEAPQVAAAIGEHYRPATAEDSLPATRTGTILSLADKLDTVAGVLWKGEAPTGTADPHGVRRRLQGIAAMLFRGGLAMDVEALARTAFALYGEADPDVLGLFDEMLLDRAHAALAAEGIEPEMRNAVLNLPIARWGQALAVARAVADLDPSLRHSMVSVTGMPEVDRVDASEPGVVTIAWRAATRPANIVGKRESDRTDVDPALFEHEAETNLVAAVERIERAADAFDAAIGAGPPEGRFARSHDAALDALRAFAAEAEIVDRYFETVMVMVEDDAVRANRLALLFRAHLAFTRVVALHHLSRG